MRRTVVPLSLLVSLTACAAAPDGPDPVCEPRAVAVLPVRMEHNAALVPVAINGTTVPMEVDTGSMSSLLAESTVRALNLPRDPWRTTKMLGTGGTVVTRNALVSEFNIGGIRTMTHSVPTGFLDRDLAGDTRVAGLLGVPELSVYDIELDAPNRRMAFWSAHGCSGPFVNWSQPHYVLPLSRGEGGLLYATVYVDGVPLRAMIDWGAQISVMTLAAARRIGVTDAMLNNDRNGTGHGIDQSQQARYEHRFNEVRIGPELFRHVMISVAPLSNLDGDMLLGMDFAQSRRVFLSYRSPRMFVAPGMPDEAKTASRNDPESSQPRITPPGRP